MIGTFSGKVAGRVVAGLVGVAALSVASSASAAVTFSTTGVDGVFWNQAWVAQSLSYNTPVQINSISGAFKDGATNDKYTFAVYSAYDGAGGFSGLLASTVVTVNANNGWTDFSFDTPVVLSGSSNGIYYIKWTPTEGGVIHQLFQWGDEGGDPLRQGSAGHLIISDAPAGVDAPQFRYDSFLVVDTTAVPEVATLGMLAMGIGIIGLKRAHSKS